MCVTGATVNILGPGQNHQNSGGYRQKGQVSSSTFTPSFFLDLKLKVDFKERKPWRLRWFQQIFNYVSSAQRYTL